MIPFQSVRGSLQTINATTSSQSISLNNNTSSVRVINNSGTVIYVRIGKSNQICTNSDTPILPLDSIVLRKSKDDNVLACLSEGISAVHVEEGEGGDPRGGSSDSNTFRNPFVFTFKTDNAGTSNNDQFTFPLISGGTYEFTVLVSDGTVFHTDDYTNNTMTINSGAGTYTARIFGKLDGFSFANGGDKLKILNISQWGCFEMKSSRMTQAFYGCSNLTVTATDFPDVSTVTTMYWAFRDCTSLVSIPNIDQGDFSNCLTWRVCFFGASNFEQDLSQLNIHSGVTDIDYMIANTQCDFDFGTYWDWSGITTGLLFAVNTNMSTANLDASLAGIEAQIGSLNSSVSVHFGNGKYSIGDPATTIYNLTTDKSWTITTGGLKYGQPISYWADFADTSTITDTSGSVDSVADKSLNSVGLTATTTQRPTTNSRTQNDLNVLDFNGTSNYMTFSTNDLVDIPFTVFIVAQIDSTTQQNILGRQTGSTAGQWTIIKNGGFAIFQTYAFGASLPATGTVKTFNTNANIHCIYLEDGSTVHYQLNNDTESTDTNTLSGYDNSIATSLVLGASPGGGNFLDGAICEIITFSGILSSSDRTEIATYLNDKWAVY